jgi:excisionase family DNA binding protein
MDNTKPIQTGPDAVSSDAGPHSHEAETARPRKRRDYHVSAKKFLDTWQQCHTITELSRKLKMPKAIIYARAAKYRKEGIQLKKMKADHRRLDIEALNRLIEESTAPTAAERDAFPGRPRRGRPSRHNRADQPLGESIIPAQLFDRLAALLPKLEAFLGATRQEYLSLAEAAEMVGVSTTFIRRAVTLGHLSGFNLAGEGRVKLRIARADVLAWVEAGRIRPLPIETRRDCASASGKS